VSITPFFKINRLKKMKHIFVNHSHGKHYCILISYFQSIQREAIETFCVLDDNNVHNLLSLQRRVFQMSLDPFFCNGFGNRDFAEEDVMPGSILKEASHLVKIHQTGRRRLGLPAAL
jgi:hypothetical protein